MARHPIKRKKQHRKPRLPYTVVPDNIRRLIVGAYLKQEDWGHLCQQCGVKLNTARSIITKYQNTGRIEKEYKGGRNKIMTKEMEDFVLNICSENCQTTLAEYQEKLEMEFPNQKIPCASTINNFLDGKYVTMKQVSVQPIIRNDEIIKQERKQYAEWFEQTQKEWIMVFFDEFSFHSLTKRTKGRSSEGTKAVLPVTTFKTHTLNSILAISCQFGLLNTISQCGTSTIEWIRQFVLETSQLFKDSKLCYICDNARVHSKKVLLDTVAPYGHIIHFLPRYSPQLNPVEYGINVWKSAIKKELNC